MQNSKARLAKKAKKPAINSAPAQPRFSFPRFLEILALPAWVGVAVFASQYFITYLLLLLAGYDTLDTPVWSTLLSALIYAFTLFVVIFVPVKLTGHWRTSREELGLSDLPTWTDLGLAPVALAVSLILGTALLYLFAAIFPWLNLTEAQALAGFEVLTSGLDRVVAFFALVVIAPVAEEIIFRGWLYGKLRAKIPGRYLSLLLSIFIVSALFGFAHLQWNVGITMFAMSAVACCLREITGTTYAGIFLHMLKNAVAFMLLYVFMV